MAIAGKINVTMGVTTVDLHVGETLLQQAGKEHDT